jgi:hypothetical protein
MWSGRNFEECEKRPAFQRIRHHGRGDVCALSTIASSSVLLVAFIFMKDLLDENLQWLLTA